MPNLRKELADLKGIFESVFKGEGEAEARMRITVKEIIDESGEDVRQWLDDNRLESTGGTGASSNDTGASSGADAGAAAGTGATEGADATEALTEGRSPFQSFDSAVMSSDSEVVTIINLALIDTKNESAMHHYARLYIVSVLKAYVNDEDEELVVGCKTELKEWAKPRSEKQGLFLSSFYFKRKMQDNKVTAWRQSHRQRQNAPTPDTEAHDGGGGGGGDGGGGSQGPT